MMSSLICIHSCHLVCLVVLSLLSVLWFLLFSASYHFFFFFFQAEDGIRDLTVTGVQTCALPILFVGISTRRSRKDALQLRAEIARLNNSLQPQNDLLRRAEQARGSLDANSRSEIGRASCRERV